MHPSTIPPSRYTRRWRVPPPLTRGGELMEGGAILGEVPGEAGVLLWKAVRSVTLWAEAAPAEMDGLFAPSAHPRRLAEIAVAPLEERLREPLELLAQLLADPHGTDREVVALACRRLALWAEDRGATGTALAFQQAAALACPGEARHAYEVGRLARHHGEMARAESWYRRAVMLGRQCGDWYSYARAYLGLGNLLMQRGSLPAARRTLAKSLRAARRHRVRSVCGMAYHDLGRLALEYGDFPAVQRYAHGAFRAYGPDHPRLPALAHDVACSWMEQGEFGLALPVLEAVLTRHSSGSERLVVAGNIARAAGGAADARRLDRAHELLLAELGDPPAQTETAAQALLNLARGAASLRRWQLAREAASHALRIAEGCGAAQITFQSEALLESVERGARAAEAPREATPAPAPDTEAGRLAAALIESVRVAG